MRCGVCPHNCDIPEGGLGFCGARKCENSEIVCESYGKVTSLALDPIEKKPLYRFFPGSRILSVGSYGCNMRCLFCQNHAISQGRPHFDYISPESLCETALSIPGNLGVAFTYNEPLVGFEYVIDCAKLLREAGQKVVLVSNGQINEEPLRRVLPLVDAWNIDIKAWSSDFYSRHGGSLEAAINTVEAAAATAHVEITTLVIPGENDGTDDIAALCRWLADISPEILYHLSRYFPRHKYDRPTTPKETLYRLRDTARLYLKNVYIGNI